MNKLTITPPQTKTKWSGRRRMQGRGMINVVDEEAYLARLRPVMEPFTPPPASSNENRFEGHSQRTTPAPEEPSSAIAEVIHGNVGRQPQDVAAHEHNAPANEDVDMQDYTYEHDDLYSIPPPRTQPSTFGPALPRLGAQHYNPATFGPALPLRLATHYDSSTPLQPVGRPISDMRTSSQLSLQPSTTTTPAALQHREQEHVLPNQPSHSTTQDSGSVRATSQPAPATVPGEALPSNVAEELLGDPGEYAHGEWFGFGQGDDVDPQPRERKYMIVRL